MDWRDRKLTHGESFYYERVNFEFLRETEKAIQVKLSAGGYKDLNTWLPKSVIRDYNMTSAYVWEKALHSSIKSAMEYVSKRKMSHVSGERVH